MYGIFPIIFYGLTRHIIRKISMQSITYCTTELSENLWKGQEVLKIATMLIQFTKTVILGYYACNFQEIS